MYGIKVLVNKENDDWLWVINLDSYHKNPHDIKIRTFETEKAAELWAKKVYKKGVFRVEEVEDDQA